MKFSAVVVVALAMASSVAAHGGSGNRNCQWGGWSGYSRCTSTFDPISGTSTVGTRTRSRGIAVSRRGGGARCTGPSSQSLTCTGCTLSQWSSFGTCPTNGAADSQRTRTRAQVANPTNGGPGCGGAALSDSSPCVHCQWAWGKWSVCDAKKFIERHPVVSRPAQNGGTPCETNPQREMCNNCVTTEWSAFSSCNAQSQSRTRNIIGPASANGIQCDPDVSGGTTETDDAQCESCQTSRWSEWGACMKRAGGFTQLRSKVVTSAPSDPSIPCGKEEEENGCTEVSQDCTFQQENGNNRVFRSIEGACKTGIDHYDVLKVDLAKTGAGAECPGELMKGCTGKTNNCEVKVPKTCSIDAVNCVLSEWSEWDGVCAGAEGPEEIVRRKTMVSPKNDAGTCPPEAERVQSKPCAVDCKFEYSEWSNCDKVSLKQARTTVITIDAKNGGSVCNPNSDDLERECEDEGTNDNTWDKVLSKEKEDVVITEETEADGTNWFSEPVSTEGGTTKGEATAMGGFGGVTIAAGFAVLAFRRKVSRREDDDEESDDEGSDQELNKEMEMSSLAPGWVETSDPNTGKTYYFNRERGSSTWNKDEAMRD